MSKIIIGISGGIAAYKVCELIRLLKKTGHDVRIVLTQCAKQFIHETIFAALSNNQVYSNAMSDTASPMLHIELAKWADLVIVAPTTATTISKLAHGDASSLLTALCLATESPCYLVPAMNTHMWHHMAVQENIKRLIKFGYKTLPPESGQQACGDDGFGRMPEPKAIMDLVFANSKLLSNHNILISAGPTYEKLDPIRYIGNFSSGKMGYAIAKAFQSMGANVHLISGPTPLQAPFGIRLTKVISAQDMLDAVSASITHTNIFISAAAIANYSVKPSKIKIKSTEPILTLTLQRTPDILQIIANANKNIFCVGFCAESGNIIELAQTKLNKKGCQAIIANAIHTNGEPFGSDENQVIYVNHQNVFSLEKMNKQALAYRLAQQIASNYNQFKTTDTLHG